MANTFKGNDLSEARLWVQQNLTKGSLCPCCNQICRLYKRKLNPTMALVLVLMYKHFRGNPHFKWIHLATFLIQFKRDSTIAGGDPAKLRYWGLIARGDPENEDGSEQSGRYVITDLGNKFVEGRIAVPERVYIYDKMLMGVSKEMITIQQALGKKHVYTELMKI